MSRFRVHNSNSEIDREVASRLDEAERAIKRALGACENYDRSKRGLEERPVRQRVRKVGRDLLRVLSTISEVRKVHSSFEEDPVVSGSTPSGQRIAQGDAVELRTSEGWVEGTVLEAVGGRVRVASRLGEASFAVRDDWYRTSANFLRYRGRSNSSRNAISK